MKSWQQVPIFRKPLSFPRISQIRLIRPRPIRYGLPREENVTLIIYNILGEEVVSLVNDELKMAGFHAVVWDGRNSSDQYVASGLYIYRFKAGGRILAGKMALVR